MIKKIKEILLMENRIFTTIHTIALILIFAIIILISILKYTIDKIDLEEQKNLLEDIKTEEDSSTDKTTSTPYDNEEVLVNPGKGMVYRKIRNNSKYNDIVSIGYYRFNWSDIEVEEGKYNWDIIDNAINEYVKENKKFAFGVMNVNSSTNKQYVTPKWVFDAGAKGTSQDLTFWENNKQVTQMVPDWKDEIYLNKLNNFIKALADRYDGNKNIAYIDIRSYGNWGEQHLGGLTTKEDITAEELKELYIKPYQESFNKTLLVNPWGKQEYNEVYKWSIDNGISIRRDGIFQHSNGIECAMAYGKLPTIFEYTSNYNWMKQNNYWSQDNLLKYIEIGKPSYLEFDEEMYKENKNFMKMIANKIGYYFKFKGAEYKNKITTKEQNEIKLNFINEGVAPLYEPCTVYIGLLNKDYKLVKKYKTDIDPHKWMPNEEKQEDIKLQLDGVEDGEYIISLGLFLDENDENPTYLLGNTGGTKNKWYVFGKINVTNPVEENNNQNDDNRTENNDSNNNSGDNNTGNNNSNNEYAGNDNNNGNNNNQGNENGDNNESIDDYIANNPVEIKYSETELTNKNVTATIETNAEIQIINNEGSKEYTFEKNGRFTFEYTIKGQAFSKTAEVNNIDKQSPIVEGVEESKIYKDKVQINVTDENLLEVKLVLNDGEIEYKPDMILTEEGFYEINAKDKAGNVTTINFEVLVKQEEQYQIKENTIENITNNTKRIDFEKMLKIEEKYEILRNDEILEKDSVIATGDILRTESGQEYTLIVVGDINKDGDVNIKDLIRMRKYLLGEKELDDSEKLAGDCNLDGKKLNIKDFIKMRILALTKSVT